MASEGIQIYQPDAQVGELKLWRPPEDVLVEAQQAAQALQKRIAGKKKPVIFNNEQYIESDDWEMLAHFYGYVAKVESTEFVEFGEIQGFKAVAVLLNERTGLIVSRAESMCLDEEENWGPRPKYEWQNKLDPNTNQPIWDPSARNGQGAYVREKVQVGEVDTPLFQLMSMAQTRACAKVTRNKLAWVVTLAGYKPTPAEEVSENTLPPAEKEEAPAPLPTEIKKREPVAPQQAPPPRQTVQPPQHQPAPRPQTARPPVQSPRAPQARTITEAQARRFYAIWKQAGRSQEKVHEYLQAACGVADDRQMPADKYEAACHWAQTGEDF